MSGRTPAAFQKRWKIAWLFLNLLCRNNSHTHIHNVLLKQSKGWVNFGVDFLFLKVAYRMRFVSTHTHTHRHRHRSKKVRILPCVGRSSRVRTLTMSWPYLWPSKAPGSWKVKRKTKKKNKNKEDRSFWMLISQLKQPTHLACNIRSSNSSFTFIDVCRLVVHSFLFILVVFFLSLSLSFVLLMFYDGKIYASLITWPFWMFLPAVATVSVLRAWSFGFCLSVRSMAHREHSTHADRAGHDLRETLDQKTA